MPAECHRQCTTWGHGQLCQPPAVLWQTASAAGQGNVVTAGEAEPQTAPTAPEPWVLLLSPGACTSRKVHVSQPSHVLQWGHWPSSLGLGVGSTGLCSCDWRPALGFPAPLSHVPRVLPGHSSPGSNWSHLEGSRGSLLSRLSLPATAAGCPWRGSGRCSSPRPPIQHLRCWTPRSLSKAPRQEPPQPVRRRPRACLRLQETPQERHVGTVSSPPHPSQLAREREHRLRLGLCSFGGDRLQDNLDMHVREGLGTPSRPPPRLQQGHSRPQAPSEGCVQHPRRHR